MTPAERQALRRKRVRFGLRVLTVDVQEFELVEAMLDAGLLTVAQAESWEAVCAVAGRILSDWQKQSRRDCQEPFAWSRINPKGEP